MTPIFICRSSDGKTIKLSTICQRQSGSEIIGFSYVNTTIVDQKFIDSCSLRLSQMASKTYCSVEQGLQGHTLLAADMPTPSKTYLPSSHPLPSLLQFKISATPVKIWFCGPSGNGKQKLNLSSFREPITVWVTKSTKRTFVPGTNLLYHFF